jgi:hypothetical protein
VLWLWEDRSFQGRPAIAAALVHVERKRLYLRKIRLVEELRTNQMKAFEATATLLECLHDLAAAGGDPRGCFYWQFESEADAANALRDFKRESRPCEIKKQLGRGSDRASRAQVWVQRCRA